ncbi:diguanylate cyclase [Sulfurimonas sp.]
MNFHINNKKYLLLSISFIVLFFGAIALYYIEYVKFQKEILESTLYKEQAHQMHKNIESMIQEKKKATTAIAISIASNNNLARLINNKEELQKFTDKLLQDLSKNTYYKTIWIQILDKNLKPVYRSWMKNSDNYETQQKDLLSIEKTNKIITTVSVDSFNISIKAMVPFFNNGEFAGILEVMSHFNSISKGLGKLGIESVLLVDKSYSKEMKNLSDKFFIDGYCIVNRDAPQALVSYLQKHGVQNYLEDEYKAENAYIVETYKFKNMATDTVAYYVMFKKISSESTLGVDFFIFKWIAIGLIFLMGIALSVSLYFFISYRKQRRYYKNIINTSTNIIITSNENAILSANREFFKYFKQYRNIKEFQKEHKCICDFFVEKSGYLHKKMDKLNWINYVLLHNDMNHKVEIDIEGERYYFLVVVSLVSQELHHYAITFSDITAQEEYKKELEELTVTDPLTKIGNRRYYQKRVEEEISRALRYNDPLSIILFDIDHFKNVNDTHGHDVGDKVLVEYTKFIATMLRDIDEFCRIGGEEFIVIVPHIDRNNALLLAEKLRKAVEAHKKVVPITMSFGVTQYIDHESQDALFKRVDDALYSAKENGRNKVVVK